MKYNWSELSARERDALVAEKVFGIKDPANGWLADEYPDSKVTTTWPHYTTDISAAWGVVDNGFIESVVKLKDGRWFARPKQEDYDDNDQEIFICGAKLDNYYEIPIYLENTNGAIAPTAPEAICLAALKAVGVEV